MHNVPLKVPVDGQAQRLGPAKKIIASEKPSLAVDRRNCCLEAGLSRRRYFADLSVSYC
jgi:hypothetical protein